jgi:hypothetical protein
MGKKRPQQARESKKPVAWRSSRIVAFLERYRIPVLVCLLVTATIRIVATYAVFNHTSDEPAHIACGLEWLDKGVYRWEPQHPPLARIATALGPYLLGARSQHSPKPDKTIEMTQEGLRILYESHHYERTLAAARCGVLPFFWLACLVVYWWGRRYCGGAGAVAAVFLFTFLPPILAHAGLATTDMAVTAFMGAALLAGLAWTEQPRIGRAVVFGLAVAGGILSKFSFLAFFPVSVFLALALSYGSRRPLSAEVVSYVRARIPTLAAAILVACLVTWAGYRFSVGRPDAASMVLPAPELFQGIQAVAQHNQEGHPGYLLGERSKTGFLLFFPVALSVKTPIPFMALLVFGIALLLRKRMAVIGAWIPLAFAAGILAVGMSSRINIGLRHILPIYICLSLVAAAAVLRLLVLADERGWVRIALLALALWFAASSALSHPDYLPYFNELAGDRPENILVDSDLDWGQDMNRLGERLRRAGAEWVMFTQFAMADLQKEHGFPLVLRSDVPSPSPGWNAVSVTVWKSRRMDLYETHPEVTPWPDKFTPQERVGKSILLWYFPPGNSRPAALGR